jgi:hypothetical protein
MGWPIAFSLVRRLFSPPSDEGRGPTTTAWRRGAAIWEATGARYVKKSRVRQKDKYFELDRRAGKMYNGWLKSSLYNGKS